MVTPLQLAMMDIGISMDRRQTLLQEGKTERNIQLVMTAIGMKMALKQIIKQLELMERTAAALNQLKKTTQTLRQQKACISSHTPMDKHLHLP